MEKTVLAINPGSTSTKFGLMWCKAGGNDGEEVSVLHQESVVHPMDDLRPYTAIVDQLEYRLEVVWRALQRSGTALTRVKAVVGRGGLLRAIPGGTYVVSPALMEDLRQGVQGEHASNLGGLMARALGERLGVPAFVVDPVSVDEMQPVARYSGLPELPRRSLWHALNCRAVARRAAAQLGRDLTDINLIVAHLGSGITVAAMQKGQARDVNNAIAEGPFATDRAGGLPAMGLVELCYSGRYSCAELKRRLMREAGVYAYLGSKDLEAVVQRALSGDSEADAVLRAMAYQVAKEIGAMSTVLCGQVDGVVITGGMAHSPHIVDLIRRRVHWVAPVLLFPGEHELEALALGGWRVVTGRESARTYPTGDPIEAD